MQMVFDPTTEPRAREVPRGSRVNAREGASLTPGRLASTAGPVRGPASWSYRLASPRHRHAGQVGGIGTSRVAEG